VTLGEPRTGLSGRGLVRVRVMARVRTRVRVRAVPWAARVARCTKWTRLGPFRPFTTVLLWCILALNYDVIGGNILNDFHEIVPTRKITIQI